MPQPTLEVRDLRLRADTTNNGTRTLTGVAVPWDTEIDVAGWWDDYREKVARGACEADENPKLYWRHAEPIGRITGYRDTDAGWEIDAQISETPRGDEAYTLLRDGVIDRMSIGFEPIEHIETKADDGTKTITRTRIKVREVSLVPFPAYDDAKISAVRSAQPAKETTPMPEADTLTRSDLDPITDQLAEMERSLTVIRNQDHAPAGPTDLFRSFGHYVKQVAAGDETALRAYEGATSGDAIVKDAWLGSLVEIIKKLRPIYNTFATAPLPPEGMGVEYAELESDTTQVGIQEDEGDDLLYGKIKIRTKRADVVTLGGWTELSRQAIERASVTTLDTTFEALAERYARAVEVYVRSILTARLAATGADALATLEADLTTQDGIVAAVLDLAEHYDNTGRSLDGILLDKASFLALYAVEATDRVLQISGAPTDKVGTLSVKTGSGEVAGLAFKLLPNAAANTVVAYDTTAIKTLESPGAPLRLQDENIVNLSKAFSIYGYLSAAVQKPAGLVKIVEEG